MSLVAKLRTYAAAGALVAPVAACGRQDAADVRAPASAPGTMEAPAPGGWTGTVELTLSSARQLDGSYRSSGAGCIRSPNGWIVSHENQTERLRMSQAVIENVGEQGGTTPLLQLTAVFGDPTDETDESAAMVMLVSDGTAAHGSGSATVRRDGDAVQIGIQGRTQQGISVQAQYRCASAG